MSDAELKSDDGITIPKRVTRRQIALMATILSFGAAAVGWVAAWSADRATKEINDASLKSMVDRHEQIHIKNAEREMSRDIDLLNLRNEIKSLREALPRIERQLERLESFDRKKALMPGAAAVINPSGAKS